MFTSFVVGVSDLGDTRPRMHLPIGTALVGALFAANMAAIILTLFSLSWGPLIEGGPPLDVEPSLGLTEGTSRRLMPLGEQPAQDVSGVRRSILIVAGMETSFWAYLVVGGLTDQLPFAKGYGEPAAVLGTLVFVPFVLPALALALLGRALPLAAVLAAIGGFLYSMDPLFRLTAALDDVPVVAVFAGGLIVALAALAFVRRGRAVS